MFQKNKKIVVTLICALIPAFAGPSARSSSVTATEEALLRRNAAENFFIQGKNAQRIGDSTLALQSFMQAWKLDSSSQYLTEHTAELALRLNEPGQAIFIMTGGNELNTLSDEKLRYAAAVYLRYQHYGQALKVYRELDSLGKDDSLTFSTILAKNRLYGEAAEVFSSVADLTDSAMQLHLADYYRLAGNHTKSLPLYEELYGKNPQNTEVKKGYGLALLAAGQEKKAMDLLMWFLPVSGGVPDEQVIELVGRFYASRGDYSDAVQLFQFLYKNDGSTRDFYFGRPLSIYAFLDRRYEYARNLMLSLLKTNSDDFELNYLLGSVYEGLNEPKLALASYYSSLEINPKFEEALRARVLVFARRNMMDSAMVMSTLYTDALPESADSWALHGSLLTMQRNFSDALIALTKSVELVQGPASLSILFELGMSQERTGDVRGAEKTFLEILERDSLHAPSANYLGYMWAESGKKLNKATTLIERALSVDPENGAYLDSYGWVLYKTGDYNNAIINLEKALTFIDDDYIVFYHLGYAFEKLGQISEALEQFKKALEFDNPQSDEIKQKIKVLENELSLLSSDTETVN